MRERRWRSRELVSWCVSRPAPNRSIGKRPLFPELAQGEMPSEAITLSTRRTPVLLQPWDFYNSTANFSFHYSHTFSNFFFSISSSSSSSFLYDPPFFIVIIFIYYCYILLLVGHWHHQWPFLFYPSTGLFNHWRESSGTRLFILFIINIYPHWNIWKILSISLSALFKKIKQTEMVSIKKWFSKETEECFTGIK